jgi:hypothetical protein
MKTYEEYIQHRTSGIENGSFTQLLEIDIISGITRPQKDNSTFWADAQTNHDQDERKKNLGQVAKGYSIWRVDDGGSFNIVHDKSKKVIGSIENSHEKPKHLGVKLISIASEHTKKKIGFSLAVASYIHLHKQGYTIHSGSQQSEGGASIWRALRDDPRVMKYVRAISTEMGREKNIGQASKLDHSEIWGSRDKGLIRKFGQEGRKMHRIGTEAGYQAAVTDLRLMPKDKKDKAKKVGAKSDRKSNSRSYKKPGETWRIKSGKWGAKNKNNEIQYFIDQKNARAFAQG